MKRREWWCFNCHLWVAAHNCPTCTNCSGCLHCPVAATRYVAVSNQEERPK